MKTTRIAVKRLFFLVFAFVLSGNAHAHGVLFEKLLDRQARHGAGAALDMARDFGVLLRQEGRVPLVPVLVERRALSLNNFRGRLKLAGSRIDAMSRSWVRLLVPLPLLERLATSFPDVQFRMPPPVKPVFGLGTSISESVALTAADGYQAGNLTGNGVRVAVVDLGFSNLSAAIAAGELPAGTVSMDFTGTGLETGTKHGTGVAEHVLDMAPGVELHCLKVNDQVDLQNAADYIAANNIAIANHSVAWVLTGYYDDTGPINDIVNSSHDNDGVFWAVASGNSARKHWRGNWLDGDGDGRLEFTGTDETMQLSGNASTIQVFLNWNQYGVNQKTDLDLYLLDVNGNTVASSTIRQSRFNDPAEAITFTLDPAAAPYSVEVRLVSGSTAGLDITLFGFNHDFESPTPSSSVMDPASAHGAFTVGAVKYSNWTKSNPAVRAYSSRGLTTDGRQKPDIVAPDGTASLTYGISSGTSFASPTVAGAAALLLQEDPALDAVTLGNRLRAEATDIGATGVDPVTGWGKLQLPLIDTDGEGLTNVEEIALGTDALLPDTDDDGLTDFDEDRTWNTDPLLPDTDTDGLDDYQEVITLGTNPLVSNAGDLAPRGAPDDRFDAGDIAVLTRLVSGEITPSTTEAILGNLNGNGGLEAGDLLLLIRKVQGM